MSVTRAAALAFLAARTPAPPAALAKRLAELVAAAPDAPFVGGSMAVVAGHLGTWVLATVVERQRTASDTALDLLAADAFVTYAFEAAAEEGSDVTGLAARLLAEVPA